MESSQGREKKRPRRREQREGVERGLKRASHTMTSRERDNVWTRAIIEKTLGGVEGRERFPQPILYLSTRETEILARGCEGAEA